MHVYKLFIGTAVAIAFSSTVSAAGLAVSETATCKLTNVAKDVAIYEGTCRVTEEVRGNTTIYTIDMGGSEPFKFATADGGKNWLHGPEDVQFRDLGKGGIFKWSDFALVVAESAAGQGAGRSQHKVDFDDLRTGSDMDAQRELENRGFVAVDGSQSASGFSNLWMFNRQTGQCVQLETAEGKVMTINEVTHPKCR
jgi:hypothetical protein